MRRSERLAAMLAKTGIAGLAELLRPRIEKDGIEYAAGAWGLPPREVKRLVAAFEHGQQYVPPAFQGNALLWG